MEETKRGEKMKNLTVLADTVSDEISTELYMYEMPYFWMNTYDELAEEMELMGC
jgi:hypothetical protein